ncbi:stimulator of interferon genes protein isoform X1 [Fundulus heteroclitus]|uniref:stimulator of interferon genes protein isoform X1 n=2 Tax=Fundulus heteroclitus TaxID=8078 RepID=UPI00165CE581|nr:stimulator of interferon genes protein isoform X1 [Fundulus heteroclitus]
MHCLRDESDLIPRPRGSLPKVCAALLATIATGVFLLMSPGRLINLLALATLIVTLGPLLHGLCLLAEEVLHHLNTRYQGRSLLSHVLPACGLGVKSLVAAAMAALLLYLTRHSYLHKGQSWELIVVVPVVYTLFISLGVLGPSEVEVSSICEERKMNVAHGLAWSFYVGYLQLVLPSLGKSIDSFRASHRNSFWGQGPQKLLILIPLNTNISHKLEDEDNYIQFYDSLPNSQLDRAGIQGRVYKHSVYRVQDENGKAHDCAVEYATPLLTLYRMSQDRRAGFGESERRQQVLLFYRTLQDILEQSQECRNRYRLILLKDEHQDDPHFLSKTILKHLEQQNKEEFCVNPAAPQQETKNPVQMGDWHNPEEISREPTLMISLERPQPLRGPVEDTDIHYRAT